MPPVSLGSQWPDPMVNIEAGVAEATVLMTVAHIVTTALSHIKTVVSRYTRPVLRFLSQGRTSLSAVSPDANTLIGGIAVA